MSTEQKTKIDDYSESSFWEKVKNYCSDIGYSSLEKALQLYYALDSEKCGIKEKGIIYGALAYLVSPIDAIPDLTPVLGYTDDVALIASALIAVSNYIDDEVKLRAKVKLRELF
ncbi:YkvA family protein [Vibrio hyugaensis]|uniref:YkvA family protein n=1 Tax=Vibrio hyugaensis TaxID=1534743 RepID=UPI000CE43C2F|nr:YkvA family protein [Vibrio hyugaensis]